MSRDFTLESYRRLLAVIRKERLPVYGVAEWLKSSPTRGVLLRHDVDRRPYHSLRMARLEAELGIRCTYYFRIVSCSLDERVLKEIAGLGHEIGYHYEDLAIAGGDVSRGLELFGKHLQRLRTLAPIATIAMHGRPLSPHDSRDLWKNASWTDFGLQGEAFLSVDYRGVYYVTDSGRTWADTPTNLRDRVQGALVAPVATTDQLVEFVASRPQARFAIVCHPERWDDSTIGWVSQLSKDLAANAVKLALARWRRA